MTGSPDLINALSEAIKAGKVPDDLEAALDQLLNPPRPASIEAARSICALVRRFDSVLYDALVSTTTDAPTFEDFIKQSDVEVVSAAERTYRMRESARAPYLAQPSLAAENERIANWLATNRPTEFRERLYHLAAAQSPKALQLFEEQFLAAETRFDLAACWDLLAILNEQPSLSPDLKRSQQDRLRRYEARSLFFDSYYRTATFLPREALRQEFHSTLASPKKWIFHIYATGGMGKTMFLRSLLSRELVPQGIPVARVDFDDLDLAVVKEAPWFVLLRVAEQLDRQLEGNPFGRLLKKYSQYSERLRRRELGESRTPLNIADVQRDESDFIASILSTVKTIPMARVVVFLDTLEEVTLAGGVLDVLLAHFQALKNITPGLYLVLSGRYDILDRSEVLNRQFDGVTNRYPIPRFDDGEARSYLESRGLKRPDLVQAIVQKVREPAGDGEKSEGSNPFKLNLFAEIAIERDSITAQQIRDMPRADLAYLLERVILRIPDQGVRWMIRHGSVPRRLTLEFAGNVLLPWLEKALCGELPEDAGDEHWKPDSTVVADMPAIWDKLSQYASRNGWLEREENPPAIRFHPDVVNPMRGLLSRQKVFPLLEDAARQYFENLAVMEESATGPEHERAGSWAEATAQAVFHSFQKDGVEAAAYWREQLRHKFAVQYPAARIRVLSEILAPEYCLDQMEPVKWPDRPEALVSRELLAEAHAAVARERIINGGADPSADFERLKQIEKAAGRGLIAPQRRFWLKAVIEAASLEPTDLVQAAEGYRFALQGTESDQERLALELRLGDVLKRLRSREAAEHFREAMRIQPTLTVPSVSLLELRFRLAESYDESRQYTAARRSLEAALLLAHSDDQKMEVLSRLVKLDVSNGMASGIEAHLRALQRIVGRDPLVDIFSAVLCLERDHHAEAEQLLQPLTSESSNALIRGQSNLTLGDIETEKLQLSSALEVYEKAVTALQEANQQDLVELAILRQVQLFERWAGNFRLSLSRATSLRTLRSYQNLTFRVPADISCIHALWRMNRSPEAKALLKKLLDEEWERLSPTLRLSVMMAGLTFDLLEANDENLKRVSDLLEDIDPPAIRVRFCDTVFFRAQPIKVSPFWRQKILCSISLPGQAEATFTRTGLKVADMLRAFGEEERAASLLRRILDSALNASNFSRARSALARLRKIEGKIASIPADLKDRVVTSFATRATPVMRAILTAEMGDSWSLPYDEAKKILDAQRVRTSWRARIEKRRGEAAERTGDFEQAGRHYQIAALLWDELGDLRSRDKLSKKSAAVVVHAQPHMPQAPVAPSVIGGLVSGEARVAQAPAAPAEAADPELVLPRADATLAHAEWLAGVTPRQGNASERAVELLCDPERARDEIGRYLFGGRVISRAACLRHAPDASAAIPWEWARNSRFTRSLVENRGLYPESVRWMQASLRRLGQQLIIDGVYGPQTEGVLVRTLGHAEGSSREVRAELRAKLTLQLTGVPRVLEIRRQRSEVSFASASVYEGSAQDAVAIYGAHGIPVLRLEHLGPATLMMVIQDQRPSVIHIVASVEETAEGWLQLRVDQDSPGMSIDLLERVLSQLPPEQVRPFIVLDIQALGGPADQARSLLLRNIYAVKLLARYCTPGILATGLGNNDEQSALLNALAAGLRASKSIGEVADDMRNAGSSLMAHQALALFTDDPDLPVSLLPESEDEPSRMQ